MAATSYAELCAEIADWIARDDLEEQIPLFIADAEARFNNVLRHPDMEQVSSSTTRANVRTITLPFDFLAARSVYLDGDPKTPISQLSVYDLIIRYAGSRTGEPRHYALQSGGEMVLGPTPGGEYAIVLNYWQKIPALGDELASNWLLAARPDIYRTAALAEACTFMKDEARADRFEAMLKGRLDELRLGGRRKAHSAEVTHLSTEIPALLG